MLIKGEISELVKGIEILKLKESNPGIVLNVKKGFNGLSVSGKNKEYFVGYGEKADFFRAVALIEGMVRNGQDEINLTEERKIKSCGVMIDCSRNSVPKVSFLKDLFNRMVRMGINLVLLYTEETYTLDDYPYFGYMRGRYSKEELKELDKYALDLGIELVPCIQTLAHLDMALRWPAMRHLADGDRTLMVDNEKTYEFIDAMLRTCRECFTTDRIHIGMDEAHELGRGAFMDKKGYEPADKIFIRHLKKVEEMVSAYGLKPMMWDDMAFRYSSKLGAYYDVDTVLDDYIVKEIPKNVAQVFWNYYKETDAEYEAFFNQRKVLDNEIMFAGGIWTWYTLGICYRKTFRATRPALEACHRHNIQTVFATIWDGGHGGYLDLYGCLLGMQLYAEFIYNEKVSDEQVAERFKLITGYDADAFLALDIDDYPDGWICEYGPTADNQDPNVSKQVLYQDALIGLFDKNFESVDLKSFYKAKLKVLNSVKVPKDMDYLFEYHKTIVSILCDKCDLGIRIRKAYLDKDTAEIKLIIAEIEEIRQKVRILKDQMYDLWHKQHKAFGWDVSDMRLSAVDGRLGTAVKKLGEFLKDTSYVIEELEEERLMFGPESLKPGRSLMPVTHFPKISTPSLIAR